MNGFSSADTVDPTRLNQIKNTENTQQIPKLCQDRFETELIIPGAGQKGVRLATHEAHVRPCAALRLQLHF
jgi:hypothetical protein